MVLTELALSTREVARLKEVPPDKLLEIQGAVAKKAPGNLTLSGGRSGMVVARPRGFGPGVGGAYPPNHPFYSPSPAISQNKTLMGGANKNANAVFERKATDPFSLTEDRLKAPL